MFRSMLSRVTRVLVPIQRRCFGNVAPAPDMAAAGFVGPLGETTLVRIPKPSPEGGQVLVAVKAASINPIDLAIRQGYGQTLFSGINPVDVRVSGCDASGVVVSDGGGAWDLKVNSSTPSTLWF